jgi:hypothetical protein
MRLTNLKNITHHWILNGLDIVLRVGCGDCETYVWSVRNNWHVLIVNYLVREKYGKQICISVLYTCELYL